MYKRKEDNIVLADTQTYDGYNVSFLVKDKKIIFTDSDYETIYKLDIFITMDSDIYTFNNYYIKIDEDILDISNVVAKSIIENMDFITFENARFIGELYQKNNKVIMSNNERIVNYLKEQVNNEKIINVFNEYKKYKELGDSNLYLKYASFLEVYFSTHHIPDEIRKMYLLNNKRIIDYSTIDKIIKDELMGHINKFNDYIKEMGNKCKEVMHLNAELSKNDHRIVLCNKVIEKTKEYCETKQNTIEQKKRLFKNNDNIDEEFEKLKEYIFLYTKANIVKVFNNININDIKRYIEECYSELINNDKELNSKRNIIIKLYKKNDKEINELNFKEKFDQLSFDDLYNYLED